MFAPNTPLTTPTLLTNGIPQKIVSLATATGTGFSQYFQYQEGSGFHWGQITLQYITANGSISALNVDLEISLDGGAHFSKLDSFDFVAVGAQRTNINTGGAIYRLNITTFTGSSTPKADIWVCAG